VPLLAQSLDLHQLQPTVAACGLQRIRPSADDDGGPRRRTAVDDRARFLRGANRFAAQPAEDSREGEVRSLQRAQHARLQRRWRIAQRVDHLVRALVAFPPLADAAVDDFLQVIRARQPAHFERTHARPRVSLDQHAEQLPDLIHVVSCLPLGDGAREDVARRGQRVHRARRDPAAIALLPDDPEISQLQMPAVADEHVERRQIAMERVAAMQLAEHFEDAGNLAPRDRLGPPLARA